MTTLDQQTENAIVEAIIALDWNTDVVTAPLGIIQGRLGLAEKQTVDLFLSFRERGLIICQPEHVANDFAETEVNAPWMRGKWIKPDETMQ